MLRVLYVDDETDLLEVGKLFLEMTGQFTVDTIPSAAGAIALLDTQKYDAIISDYQMPEMNGIALLKAVREQYDDIPFILFTGRGREEVVIEAINNGADFYIQKGGDPEAQFAELAQKIRQALRRKESELSLSENREYLNQIFASVQAGILIIDAKSHTIIDLNPAAEKLIGTTKDQITGKVCHRFICPAEQGRCPITDLHQNVDNAERVLQTAGGGKTDIIKYVVPFTYRGRKCLLETFLDNTERKRNADELRAALERITSTEEELRQNYDELGVKERELHESEEKNRLLLRNMNDGMILHAVSRDGPGQILDVNDRVCEMLGYTREELLRRSIGDIEIPLNWESTSSIAAEIFSTGGALFQTEFVHKDQRRVPVEISARSVELGGIKTVLAVVRDITERIKADQALRESEEKYRMLVEYTLDGILIVDPGGTILFANQAAGNLVGTDDFRTMMSGHNVMEFIDTESREEVIRDLSQAAQGIDGFLVRYRIITLQGQKRWVELIGKSIVYDGAPVIHISLRDITEQMRSQKALDLAKKKLNLLNYVTFNDIQNMIFTLSGYQQVSRNMARDSPAEPFIGKEMIILEKISQNLKFAQSYQDLGLKPPRWQNVNHVFLLAISHLDFLKIHHTLRLEGLEIFAEPLLEQVFQILADNVLKHGKTASEVTFRFTRGPEDVTLFFEDDGVGIPEDIKTEIFLPDFQKQKGVGLFLAREILDITGISIRESGTPGKGARFEMVIPKGMYRFTDIERR